MNEVKNFIEKTWHNHNKDNTHHEDIEYNLFGEQFESSSLDKNDKDDSQSDIMIDLDSQKDKAGVVVENVEENSINFYKRIDISEKEQTTEKNFSDKNHISISAQKSCENEFRVGEIALEQIKTVAEQSKKVKSRNFKISIFQLFSIFLFNFDLF